MISMHKPVLHQVDHRHIAAGNVAALERVEEP
jgi:hypothetical protein